MRKSAWLLSAGLIALSVPAYAQGQEGIQPQPDSAPSTASGNSQTGTGGDQTTGQQQATTGDIVITANRRNEALSDVPIAVSAVTSESLRNSGASDIRALTQLSPSLLVSSTSSEGGAAVARIRGIGTVGDNPGLEASVGVFIDGVYRSRTGSGLTELGAVDRIEVLRGPQGTLFGRNTSAGLISIITARPRFEPEAFGQIDIGNYNLRRLEAGITGGFTDTIAGRLDGVFMKRDGYLKDVISGRRVNDRDRWLLRGQLLFQPSSDLSFRFIADYAKRNEECCAATYLPAYDVTAAGRQPSLFANMLRNAFGAVINDDTFKRQVAITPGRSYRSDVKDGGLSGELVYDFGPAELTSITAYRYNKYTRGQDADFNNADILYRDDDGTAYNRFKTFSQELRLQGTAGRFDWLIGGYYANEKLRVRDNLAYGNDYLKYLNCRLAITPGAGLEFAYKPDSPTCLSEPALAGAQAQLAAGIAQIQAGIAQLTAAITALSAIPNPTPQQAAQLAALIAQRAGLQTQLVTLGGQAQTIGIINANPNNPGFGSVANALGIPGNNPFNVRSNDIYDQTSNNFALFTHNIFSITDQLKLTLGARWTREKKSLDASFNGANPFCNAISQVPALATVRPLVCVIPGLPTGATFNSSDSHTESKISGTAVISYKPTPELLTYASYSRGYKAGGYNLDRASLPRFGGNGSVVGGASNLRFKPEINDAVELGAKYNGRGFDVNVAAFQELFDNFQLNLFNGISFEVSNVNGCKDDLGGTDTDNSGATGACPGKLRHGVRSRGLELEVFARPMRDLSLNAGATVVNTRYSRNLVGAGGAPTSGELFQLPTRRISNSAGFTTTGSITWTPPLGASGLKGLVYFDGRYSSKYNTGSDLDIEKTQKGYAVFNGRLGISGPGDTWAVELWGRNLFNKDYLQVAFDAPLQGSGTTRGVEAGFYARSTQLFGAFLAEPRTFGMTLRGRLGLRHAAAPVYEPMPVAPPPPVVEQPVPVAPPPPPPANNGERG